MPHRGNLEEDKNQFSVCKSIGKFGLDIFKFPTNTDLLGPSSVNARINIDE
jgi:hypothetical protein